MPNLFAGALRAAALIAALVTGAAGALAHGDEDHGAKTATVVTTAKPRIAVHSERYELVGTVRGPWLDITLDRYATNEPVPDAKIAVTIGDEEAEAEPAPNGNYKVASGKFAGSGPIEMIFAIKAEAGDDLLIGTLTLPERAHAAAAGGATPSTSLSGWRNAALAWARSSALGEFARAAIVLTFALGLCAGLVLRRRRQLVPTTALVLAGLLVVTGVALAHGDEDHGGAAPPVAAAETPQRLSDGAVFVPKPSQRLLEVRTAVTQAERAERAIALIGRVIADPNRGGVVQSLNGGRITAPEKGLPRLGQAVRKGDVLALVEPALPQADRTTIAEKVGDIEQQIAVVETRLNRVRPLAERGIVPQSQISDAQTEIEGLKRRREIVARARTEPETLRAPVDGVISTAKVVAGQVVGAQDVLFQIVDPRGLWVEALVFGGLDPARIKDASALASDGTSLKLAFQGFGPALQQQASVVQFAVVGPPPSLSIGQPVTVMAKDGVTLEGIILPREAVVRGGNGEAQVWRHTDPERFEPRPVRTEPFDATRVAVLAGVAAGERIVIRGAELINQVR